MAYSLQRNGWPVEKVTCFVMNADSLTMLCREGDVEANDNFQRQFSPSCTFSKYRLKIRWFCPQPFFWCTGVFACCERCPCRSPTRGPWLVGVVFGPVLLSWMGVSSAHSLCWYSNDQNHFSRSGTCWQPSKLSVEVRNLSGANRFSPCRWMLLVSACTFPRPSVVMKHNQLYSEMRNVGECFFDVTTRMLCFVLQDSWAQISKV